MQLLFTPDATAAAQAVKQRLIDELQAGKKVLWFVTGGSNIPLCVEIMSAISDELSAQLTIILTDERYGPIGHEDSNWQQMLDIGFDAKQALALPVLEDKSLDETVTDYADHVKTALKSVDVVIGQYGMGADGHIAGILPGSVGTIEDEGAVISYEGGGLNRITTTFPVIRQCSVAYLLAFGSEKKSALEKLQQPLNLSDQPAQILKQIDEAYIYNDQIGDKI